MKLSYANHHVLRVLYRIYIEISNDTPLSIRSGRTVYGTVDNPVVRVHGKPYIPGSSLKGALRSEAERYVRTVYGEDPSYVCNILDPNIELNRKKSEGDNYVPCYVCRIFGGPTVASHIFFEDAYSKSYSIETRRRVSINRITGSQHAGRLFDVEYVAPGAIFETEMEIKNIDIIGEDSEEAKILRYVLKSFFNGYVKLGSMKSVGLGSIRVELKKATRITIDKGKLKEEDVTLQLENILRS